MRGFLIALALMLVGAPAYAQMPAAAPGPAQVQIAKIAAHPALWTVHSKSATVYLFGSIHLLPDNVSWHTPEIDRAMAASSTFVFEAPLDEQGKAEVAEDRKSVV